MVKKIITGFQKFFARRALVLLVVFALLTSVLIARLVDLQLINGQEYADSFTVKTTATRTLKSTRGNIYDVNGKLLAYNKLANNITMEDNGSYDTTREKNLALNGEIYLLTQMIDAQGDQLSHDFHIVMDDDGNYTFDTENTTTLARFRADVYGYQTVDEMSEEEASASAEDIMKELTGGGRYAVVITGEDEDEEPYTADELSASHLPEQLTKEEALNIVVVRYQLSLVSYQRYVPVTVATDVSEATVAVVKENADLLQGVSVSQDYIRVYNCSEAMAPIIGYTGKPSSEELTELQAQDSKYNSNSIIGKTGIEQYMETTLQGTDGSEEVTIDNLGTVISINEDSIVQPQQGNDVYLTIDSDLQEACYKILEERIAGIILLNLVDAKTTDATTLDNNDTVSIASYDCYFQMINNNIIDMDHFEDADASDTEKTVYEKLASRQTEMITYLMNLLTSGTTAYSSLSDADKTYVDYLIDDYLMSDTGILDETLMETDDDTYQAYFTDETIGPGELLRYAANNNWIDVSELTGDEEYLTSDETFEAVIAYLTEHLAGEDDFNKLLYKYMLQDDVISPAQIMQILYDQGVLSTDDAYYSSFSSGDVDAYELLYQLISNLDITPAMLALDPCAGSIVITDPDTGEVRACVTYPGYDNNRLANDMDTDYYAQLNTDQSTPFYNMATQQLSAPGSTFKPVMAAAGLTEGVITSVEGINCTGEFGTDIEFLSDSDRVDCWNTSGHGIETVTTALRDSCNVFFCTIGYRLGLDSDGSYEQSRALELEQKYAALFGLDQNTGIQISESEPNVSDSLPIPSSIGQGTHQYTTTQLARYASAIADRGTVLELNLVKSTADSSGNTLTESEPTQVLSSSFSSEVWENIFTGMNLMAQNDTNWSTFSDTIAIYAKTGTAQESSLRPDHALTIGFTKASESVEYDDVAFAVRIANGYSSTNATLVAKDALNYYFHLADESEIITGAANSDGMSRQIVAD